MDEQEQEAFKVAFAIFKAKNVDMTVEQFAQIWPVIRDTAAGREQFLAQQRAVMGRAKLGLDGRPINNRQNRRHRAKLARRA